MGGRALVPEVSRETQTRYRAPAGAGVRRYVFANFILVLLGTALLGFFTPRLAVAQVAIATGVLVFALIAFGGLLESKRWAKPLEAARLLAVVLGVLLWQRVGP
jgi:alkylglycerol monooxygenase